MSCRTMLTIEQFLSVVAVFCRAGAIAEPTLSTRLFNDGKRIGAIRAGSDVGARRLALAMSWLSQNWPDGAEWPTDVARPPAPQEAAE